MADINMESPSSYSALERFLIWFLIPFVFTAVLLGVLLSIFDYDIKSGIQKTLHSIPVLGSVVPAPKVKAVVSGPSKTPTAEQSLQNKDDELAKLKTKVTAIEDELQKNADAGQQKDAALKDTKAKIADLEEKLKAKTQTDEEYAKQISQLADLYAKMTPSKAAVIMENLTLKERVLVFSMMKEAARGAILEKMNAQKAAEASIGLKDIVSVKDMEIAALQERLAINGSTVPTKAATTVSKSDLGQTFASMVPKSAASVLLEMQAANSEKMLAILSSMDNASRSKVMSVISDLNKEAAASITAKLAQ
jgi:flagellar motility protein MotE (MotC chaperone)